MAYITIGILAKFAYAIQYAAVGLDWFMGIVPFVASCTVTAWLVETLCNMVAALPLIGYLCPATIPALASTAAPAVAAPIYTCKFITAAIAALGSVITCCRKGEAGFFGKLEIYLSDLQVSFFWGSFLSRGGGYGET